VIARGHVYGCQVLALEAVFEPAACAALELEEGPVFHSRIVHFENRLPIQYEDRYVNPRVFPNYLNQDFTLETPNKYLVRIAPIKRAEYRIEAKTPDAQVRKRLLMDIGEPCPGAVPPHLGDERCGDRGDSVAPRLALSIQRRILKPAREATPCPPPA